MLKEEDIVEFDKVFNNPENLSEDLEFEIYEKLLDEASKQYDIIMSFDQSIQKYFDTDDIDNYDNDNEEITDFFYKRRTADLVLSDDDITYDVETIQEHNDISYYEAFKIVIKLYENEICKQKTKFDEFLIRENERLKYVQEHVSSLTNFCESIKENN